MDSSGHKNDKEYLHKIELTLERGTTIKDLRIMRWDGKNIEDSDTDLGVKGLLRIGEKERFFGKIKAINQGKAQIDTRFGLLQVPLKEISSFSAAKASTASPSKTQAQVWINDTLSLGVNNVKIEAGKLSCQHPQLGKLILDLNYVSLVEFSKVAKK